MAVDTSPGWAVRYEQAAADQVAARAAAARDPQPADWPSFSDPVTGGAA